MGADDRKWHVAHNDCWPPASSSPLLPAPLPPAPREGVGPPTVRLALLDGAVRARPVTFLGDTAFATYKLVCSRHAAQFLADGLDGRPANEVPAEAAQGFMAALTGAGFLIEVAPELRAHLERQLAGATTAAAAADAHLAEQRAELAKRGLAARAYQEAAVLFLAERTQAGLFDDMGLGKQQPLDATVWTPKGRSALGDLAPGDEVIGSAGAPVTVQAVFLQGVQRCYRVTMSDGSSAEAGPDHLWTVLYRRAGRHLTPLTVTTEQLRTRPRIGRLDLSKTILYLPMLSSPAEMRGSDLPLPPYVFGALLANGCLGHGTPQLVYGVEDWPAVRPQLTGVDLSVSRQYDNTFHTNVLGVTQTIRDLGLAVSSAFKRIPACYLAASPSDRIQLLHGLMDADGSCSATGNRVTYHTISPELARDVVTLVESLGGCATAHRYDRAAEQKPVEFHVRVRLPLAIPPFTVPRKAARYRPGSHAHPTRSIVSVEYTRDAACACIKVDAADGLYATDHFILTHNTISEILSWPKDSAVVVVCPAIVVGNWRKEIARWAPHLSVLEDLDSGTLRALPARGQVRIISYDRLPEDDTGARLAEECGHAASLVLVADEAHRLKTPPKRTTKAKALNRTGRWRALADAVRERGGTVHLLTGTPLLNRRDELWEVLQAAGLGEEAFGAKKRFRRLLAEAPDEFALALKGVALRRSKAEVLTELPPIVRTTVTVAIDAEARRELDAALQRFVELAVAKKREEAERRLAEEEPDADLRRVSLATTLETTRLDVEAAIEHVFDGSLPVPFELIARVKALLALAKSRRSLELLDELEVPAGADERYADPLVFFSFHREPARLASLRPGWALIDGSVPPGERTKLVDRFQAGELAGLALTGAGGEGITLTRAGRMVFNDEDWTPAANAQALSRLHRMGQGAASVQVIRVVADHILDERIAELIAHKQAEFDGAVGVAEIAATARGPRRDEPLRQAVAAAQPTHGAVVLEPARGAEGEAEEEAAAGLAAAALRDLDKRLFQLRRQLAQRGTLSASSWRRVLTWWRATRPDPDAPRPAANETERGTYTTLMSLAEHGSAGQPRDRFTDHDRGTGQQLAFAASTTGLTPGQWALARLLVRKYEVTA